VQVAPASPVTSCDDVIGDHFSGAENNHHSTAVRCAVRRARRASGCRGAAAAGLPSTPSGAAAAEDHALSMYCVQYRASSAAIAIILLASRPQYYLTGGGLVKRRRFRGPPEGGDRLLIAEAVSASRPGR